MSRPSIPLRILLPGALFTVGLVYFLTDLGVEQVAVRHRIESDATSSMASLAQGAAAFARALGVPRGGPGVQQSFVTQLSKQKGAERVSVVDGAGRPLATAGHLRRPPGRREPPVADVAKELIAAAAPSGRARRTWSDLRVGAIARLDDRPMRWLVTECDVSSNLAAARGDALRELALELALALALAVALGAYIDRRVSRPAERLVRAAGAFAAGDRDARTGLAGDDELSRVGAAFDRLAERIGDAERSRGRASALLDAVMAVLPVGVLLIDRETFRVLVVNERWGELFPVGIRVGDPVLEALSRVRLERLDGTPYPREELASARVQRTGRPAVAPDVVFVTEDGRRVPIYVTALPVNLSGGETFDSILVAMQDRGQLERALHDWAQALEHLALGTGVLLYDWDLLGGGIRRIGSLTGAVGRPTTTQAGAIEIWKAKLHPDDRERVAARFAACLASGEPYEAQYRYLHGGQRWIVVRDRAHFEKDANGRPIRMIGMMDDVTERENLESQLRQAQKMETVGTLAGGVAHDFNNQLTGILGHLALLAHELPPGDERSHHVAVAMQAAERCADLTRGLLAFSRQLPSHPRPTSLATVVRETVAVLERTMPVAIRIETDVPDSLPAVLVDPVQLQQVLFNLCLNARDAMRDGGRLRLAGRHAPAGRDDKASSRAVEIAVIDDGEGIPADVLPRIFEPFFTTKPVGEGTGLGLSMAYGIVTQHGGRIEVTSSPGAGSTFRVLLPVADEPVAATPAPPAAGRETRLPPMVVLVVDDEPAVLGFAGRALEGMGHRVVPATSHAEAHRAIAADASIGLALVDLVMPEGNGVTLVAALRERRPELAVVLTSGYMRDERHDFPDGTAFLQKPYTPAQLAAAVREAVAAKAQNPERAVAVTPTAEEPRP